MRALLLQPGSGADHFAGMDDRLRALGVEPLRAVDDGCPPRLPEDTRVVAVADTLRLESIAAIRAARERGVPTMLLMDGIVEWRNTHANPSVDAGFLRPAPVDLVACAGWIDRAVLRSMGNDARATGLPRLAATTERRPLGDTLLIATARRPAFSEMEHERVRWSLRRLAHAVERLGVRAAWRVPPRLAGEIGVEPDTAPLADSLHAARAVMTTVSTLVIEAMNAGRPTALIHPHGTPLWLPALWVWRGGPEHADPAPVIENLFEAEPGQLDEQDRTLATIHRRGDAAARLARTIASLAQHRQTTLHRPLPCFARPLTPAPARVGGPLRVCVLDASPASVTDARERARRAVAAPSSAGDVRTLVVITDPRSPLLGEHDRSPGAGEHVVALDPTSDHTARIAIALEAVETLAPDEIDPGPTDLGLAIKALWDASRGRLPDCPDRGLRLDSLARWDKPWADDPCEARRWIESALRLCGATRIGADRARPGDDAVILDGPYLPETHGRVLALRRDGVAAVVAPALTPPAWVAGAVQLGTLARAGARRLAVYGAGAHTRRLTPLFAEDLPIVAILDDEPGTRELHGIPVLTPAEAVARHVIDGVLLSSDACEPVLWKRAELFRAGGVPVRAIYGAGGPSWIDDQTPESLRRSA